VIYFVTICVANREPVLANAAAFNAFKTAMGKFQHWRILAAMLMPDHLHVITRPTRNREEKLGDFSGALKRWMRQELHPSWSWQPGCFDRLLRFDESLHEKYFTFRKIRCAPDWLNTGEIGHTKSASTLCNCRAATLMTASSGQAERLPYNN
jgi:REP element-mobilizing transposase RayT